MPLNQPVVETLQTDYAPRHFTFHGVHDLAGVLTKEYEISTTPEPIPETDWDQARQLMTSFVTESIPFERTGLGVAIVHQGADGSYILLMEWISGIMTRSRIFLRNASTNGVFIGAPEGLAPCVWGRAIFSHENDAFKQLLTARESGFETALQQWKAKAFSGTW